jgi:HEAT repeat protein
MSDQSQKHVFISYVREDREQVDRLCQDLESHGVKVWLDRNSIKPGARWKDAIRNAIKEGAFFIACFSNEYASKSKTYMNEELTLAIEELRQFGTGREWFIPLLLSECDVPARSIGAGETLLDINWVPFYEDWEAGIKKLLSVIKPIPPRIQNLIYASRSEESIVRIRAIFALGRSRDPLAVSFLIGSLKDRDKDCRQVAAQALGDIGSEAKSAVSDLIIAIKDENENIRRSAARSLGKIGPEAKAAMAALIGALEDQHEHVRKAVANAIGEIGPDAKTAVPALIEALKDKNEDVRKLAVKALGSIGREAKDAVPTLVRMLNDWKGEIHQSAKNAIERIGIEAIPLLVKALKDKNKNVRKSAAETLEMFGPEAKIALPALIEAICDQDKDVRVATIKALGGIGPKAKLAVPTLIEALKDKERRVRWEAPR